MTMVLRHSSSQSLEFGALEGHLRYLRVYQDEIGGRADPRQLYVGRLFDVSTLS